MSFASLALSEPSFGAAQNTCPASPPAGSTLVGGLEVTGVCHLVDVTVNGGIDVESTGHLELEFVTVNGGVTVEPGGELDSGHVTPSSDVATFNPSTINGTVAWEQGSDLDLDNATVNGDVKLDGPLAPGTNDAPTICGSSISGSLQISDLNGAASYTPPPFGDPGEALQSGPHSDCPGNTIGSVIIRDSEVLELEGNQISGSAQLFDSQIDFWGNTVGGSLHCHGTSALTNGDNDATPNTVTGDDSC